MSDETLELGNAMSEAKGLFHLLALPGQTADKIRLDIKPAKDSAPSMVNYRTRILSCFDKLVRTEAIPVWRLSPPKRKSGKRKSSKFDSRELKEIVKLVRRGMRTDDIAKKFKWSTTLVRLIAREAGAKMCAPKGPRIPRA
jgi:hypothetical protein